MINNILFRIKNTSNVEETVKQRKKECIEENNQTLNINSSRPSVNKRPIGINRMGIARFGGITSASNDYIEEDREVIIEQGLMDNISIFTGNLDDVYINLYEKIRNEDIERLDLNKIVQIVYQVVNEYFGEKGNIEKRMENLLDKDTGISTLSELKGKNFAACVERAVLSQNLFKMLSINSTIKQSSITNKGNEEGHAYNIIRSNGKNYIYDSALPRIDATGKKQPIVGTLSDEQYMLITNGSQRLGCKTQEMDNGIIYDSSFDLLSQELGKLSSEQIDELKKQLNINEKQNDER